MSTSIADCRFSADGQIFHTVGANDNRVVVWQTKNMQKLGVLVAPPKVHAFDISADLTHISFALGMENSYVQLSKCVHPLQAQHTKSKKPQPLTNLELTGHNHARVVWDCSIHPTQPLVVTCSQDSTLKLWQMNDTSEQGSVVTTLTGHRAWVQTCTFSHDGTAIASGGGAFDATCRVWDAETGKARQVLSGHRNSIYASEFAPDDALLVTGSCDYTARLWDCRTSKFVSFVQGHPSWVYACSMCPSGKILACGTVDGKLRIWDMRTLKQLFLVDAHESQITKCRFSPAGDGTLITCSRDCNAIVWDAKTKEQKWILPSHSSWRMANAVTTRS